jgi:hypothetical protein
MLTFLHTNKNASFNQSGRRQLRPKSLAVSTPTKLLSLEEARQRALVTAKEPSAQVFLDVGGGPAALPPVYHTIIDLPKRYIFQDWITTL